jgi:purine-binding chemotaxis protein CheW
METVLTFKLDDKTFACQLEQVQRVIWAIEITPLPGQGAKVKGVVNIEEVVVPIVDLRKIIGLPPRNLELDDDIVIAHSAYGPVGMVVDSVEGVANYPDSQLAPITTAISSYASGVLKTDDNMIIIVDPSKMIDATDLPDVSELSLSDI